MKIILLFLTIPFLVLANGIVVCKSTPCSWQDFSETISNLFREIIKISFWVAFLMVGIGAFLMMFAEANEKMYARGKDLIWSAILGYVFILGSGIVFDIILEFFSPQFKTLISPRIVYAQTLEPKTFYSPFRDILLSGLKCGKNAEPIFGSPSLGRLFSCLFEIIGLLKNIAIVLLVLAIIISAFYLITTPLFGLKQIPRAYKILVWSIIGLVVILLADVIKSQIEKLLK